MTDSLRDQLLKAGFSAKPRVDKTRGNSSGHQQAHRNDSKRSQPAPQSRGVDLARAYALRAQTDKAERDKIARETQREAEERRDRKRRLHELLNGKTLSISADAEHVRHFEHAGKIRRIHVDADQLARLNVGELGVAVQAGRFLLVTRDVALQVQTIAPDAIALLVDPDAAPDSDNDGVPDDLMW